MVDNKLHFRVLTELHMVVDSIEELDKYIHKIESTGVKVVSVTPMTPSKGLTEIADKGGGNHI